MKKVTVIATVHKENGAANPQALALILKSVAPEVIFLETPKEEMERFFSVVGLESQAIGILSKYQPIDLVPVDTQIMRKAELTKFQKLFEFLDSGCDELALSMHKSILRRVRSDGFGFLNSQDYIEAQACVEMREEKLVESQGDQFIQALHVEWKSVHLRRENGMIERIASYCSSSCFENAVFLVGAAHIHSFRIQINDRCDLFNDVKWVYGV